ncbi:helix-hairpin-helix domain-containing protein [uncultured Cyclobacterium sp.]|uniref:ComEA family DNA-binding protein n=1 Tax=uncultured Cyclobacterium sp. TaxID=453820 RepID=UPI0030ED2D45
MLKSYLGFTRREMRGFVFVIPVLTLLYAAPYFIERHNRSAAQTSYLTYIAENKALFSQEPSSQERKATGNERSSNATSTLKRPAKPSLNKISFTETTAVELQMVQGVGPVLSARIAEYRSNLGGFNAPEQLLEVYGVNAELAEKIYTVFTFEPKINRKLNVNNADFKQLIKHPYIDYGAAKVILAYRNQHGNYDSAKDLLNIKIFNEAWVNRIAPYLAF